MERTFYLYLLLFALTVGLSGCDLIGDIFEAGLIVGVILVILAVAVVFWIVRKVQRKV